MGYLEKTILYGWTDKTIFIFPDVILIDNNKWEGYAFLLSLIQVKLFGADSCTFKRQEWSILNEMTFWKQKIIISVYKLVKYTKRVPE